MKLSDYGHWTIIEDEQHKDQWSMITRSNTVYLKGLFDINFMLKYYPNAVFYYHTRHGEKISPGPLKIKESTIYRGTIGLLYAAN